jgi:nitroreductase/NAD-dependent dihydropyrimidine dehydrogenase PreA subunit
MDLFTVDRAKCNLCGLCAEDCPGFVVAMNGREGFPALADGGRERCLKCGHCVAVCPTGAFAHSIISPGDCVGIDKRLLPSAETVEHFLKSRRSIRAFKQESVDHATLEKMLDIARYAPSGHNTQPVSWTVVSGRERLKGMGDLVVEWMRAAVKERPELDSTLKLSWVADSWSLGIDILTREAPHIVIAHAPWSYEAIGQEASIIALTYLELAAHSLGVGACWAGYFKMAAVNYAPLQKALGIPEGHRPYGAMMLGYPKYRYSRIPLRKEPDVMWL